MPRSRWVEEVSLPDAGSRDGQAGEKPVAGRGTRGPRLRVRFPPTRHTAAHFPHHSKASLLPILIT